MTRTILYYDEVELTILDELQYLQTVGKNYASGGLIDMPQ